MKAYKDKQFLVFEFEDNKNVKYNLSNGEFIGKSGKVVSNLCSQLKDLTIKEVIEMFKEDNPNYYNFLNFVNNVDNICKNWWSSSKYYNVGTFLSKVRKYQSYEQIFSSGIKEIIFKNLKNTDIQNIPKSLLKICKEYNITLSDTLIDVFSNAKNQNIFITLLKEEYNMLSIKEMLNYATKSKDDYYISKFLQLISEHNYKPKSLAKYIDNIMSYEGENDWKQVVNILFDYVRMQCQMQDILISKNIKNKFDKYPRYLRTIHNITARNYNRLKIEYNEEIFENIHNNNLNKEWKYGDYVFIYPNKTTDIKDEAVQQTNCVASYIDNVIERRCDIVFMRNKDNKDKSLVTIEIRDNKCVQCKGKCNTEPTEEQWKAINEYNKYLAKVA